MKALVATKQSQGARKNDFCHVPEGELVTFAGECDTDRDSVDGNCGCRRSMSGTLSLKATTTFKVVELPGGIAELATAVRESYKRGGWDSFMKPAEIETMIKADVRELVRVAGCFDLGQVLEKRGSKIQSRDRSANLWRLR
jgi:hypothetical protein